MVLQNKPIKKKGRAHSFRFLMSLKSTITKAVMRPVNVRLIIVFKINGQEMPRRLSKPTVSSSMARYEAALSKFIRGVIVVL